MQLVQSSSSSRARSNIVMNQTMFDVPGPLVVHVLLLTRVHMIISMKVFASFFLVFSV